MAETIPKLNRHPSVVVKEKSPPPTGLLINHGKPNFTISKITHQNNVNTHPKPVKDLAKNLETKTTALKKTNQIFVQRKFETPDASEFLEIHRKISEKIAKENGVENIPKDKVDNNNFSAKKPELFKQSEKIDNGPLQIAPTGVEVNRQDAKPKIKDHHYIKPALPEKPAALQVYKPVSPLGLNANSKAWDSKLMETPVTSPDDNGGVNYEQKTVVSFSKDLSLEPNKYPDTVKVVKPVEINGSATDRAIVEGLSKLKFEIASNGDAVVPTIKDF